MQCFPTGRGCPLVELPHLVQWRTKIGRSATPKHKNTRLQAQSGRHWTLDIRASNLSDMLPEHVMCGYLFCVDSDVSTVTGPLTGHLTGLNSSIVWRIHYSSIVWRIHSKLYLLIWHTNVCVVTGPPAGHLTGLNSLIVCRYFHNCLFSSDLSLCGR